MMGQDEPSIVLYMQYPKPNLSKRVYSVCKYWRQTSLVKRQHVPVL